MTHDEHHYSAKSNLAVSDSIVQTSNGSHKVDGNKTYKSSVGENASITGDGRCSWQQKKEDGMLCT